NKLSGSGPKNTSAVIREALEQYLERRNSDN
ncbi:TPA: ribbon-helix-helix protein, CopG family, partial [Klebsiella pneumoniae]|nr:ribbon-helix-helix protein, CopG family [Klebsiella pneumoniae]